jgi:hypothetical protein
VVALLLLAALVVVLLRRSRPADPAVTGPPPMAGEPTPTTPTAAHPGPPGVG